MDPIIFLLLLTSSFGYPFVLAAQSPTSSRISVVGVVYCDTCSTNTFSKQSYFLPGVEVHIECKFRAISAKSSEQMSFSVNRSTEKDGVYKLDIASVDGVNCLDGSAIASFCQASLMGSSSSSTCNVPLIKTTSNEISVKSKQGNLCTFSLNALSYRPYKINSTLCGTQKQESPNSLSSSYGSGFPCPPLPRLPFPSFPSSPFPPLPFPNPPSLPFPFPQLPPFPTWVPRIPSFFPPPPPAFNFRHPTTWVPRIPSFFPPPPPAFNFRHPTTWVPRIPSFFPPPPPAFNFRHPTTWVPRIPSFSPPPPPAFNFRHPTTWIPHIPSFSHPPPPPLSNLEHPTTRIPPNTPQNKKP